MKRTAAVLAVALLAAVVVAAGLLLIDPRGSAPQASPSPTVSPTAAPTPAVSATATPASAPSAAECVHEYDLPDPAIVPLRAEGEVLQAGVDLVLVREGQFGPSTWWFVRFFNPRIGARVAEVPLNASVRNSEGHELRILGYVAGRPNAHASVITAPLKVEACDVPSGTNRGAMILVVHSEPIDSGAYRLSVREVRLPEGATADVHFELDLTCSPVSTFPPTGLDCR